MEVFDNGRGYFGLFLSQLLSGTGTLSRNTVRAVTFPNFQMRKLLQVVKEKEHMEADACIQEERDSFQLCPSTGGFQPISLPSGICKT